MSSSFFFNNNNNNNNTRVGGFQHQNVSVRTRSTSYHKR